MKHTVTIKGVCRTWAFPVLNASNEDVKSWRHDGLVIDEVKKTVPRWTPSWLDGVLCWVQDLMKARVKS